MTLFNSLREYIRIPLDIEIGEMYLDTKNIPSAPYPAHIRMEADGQQTVQTAAEHCRNTAKTAGECLEKLQLNEIAGLAGMLHDMGKFKEEFRKYLLEGIGSRGSVIHTFAGAKYVLENFRNLSPEQETTWQDITAEIVAYAVAAHHGSFDLENDKDEGGFQHRLRAQNIAYEESVKNYLDECILPEALEAAITRAAIQTEAAVARIQDISASDMELSFHMGLLERLILSAVIEGDRRDTAGFMTGCYLSPAQPDWSACLHRVEEKLLTFPTHRPIDRARREISEQCRRFAEKPGGILRLNVPTGAGKTLSSLRYAVAHAMSHKKTRIIFTAPLLTILEQNAAVLRSFIQDDSIILEHHSNVINTADNPEAMDDRQSLLESWDAPVIITTMVQLLNTMFSGKTAAIRRFHSLTDSVIVIDEVQTVPLKMLSLFNMTLNFLSQICGATIVLCSATQPELGAVEHPILGETPEIVPYDREIWSVFQRTTLQDGGSCRLAEVPAFAERILEHVQSLLIVCNKKDEAASLYHAMLRDGRNCFHISAAMCPEHRRNTLKRIYTSLNEASQTICISTQVIEAGVDISFGAVIRLAAGMDSVVQSAGRCNRNAESPKPAPVYILRISDENLKVLPDILRGKDATISLLNGYQKHPEQYQHDLSSDPAIRCYYRTLYKNLNAGHTEYPIAGDTLMDLLAENTHYAKPGAPFFLQQAFKMAGDAFSVFDEDTIDAVVPYERGKEIIAELLSERASRDYRYLKDLLRAAKSYTVSIYDHQRKKLEQDGALTWICEGAIAVLAPDCYDSCVGLTSQNKNMVFLEV